MVKPTIEQMEEFFVQVRSGRMTGEVLQRVMENPDRYNPNLGRFGRIYQTTVNYDLGLPRLIKDAGQNYVDDNLKLTNFPIEGTGVREGNLELYEFDRTVTGPEGVELIEADGYQLEGPAELCAFIAVNRMAQLRRPIVALKVRWQRPHGHVCVPCAGRLSDDKRGLYLAFFEDDFRPFWCVLVSRKPDLGQ